MAKRKQKNVGRKTKSAEELRELRRINYFNAWKDERGRLVKRSEYTGRVYIGTKKNGLIPLGNTDPEKYAHLKESREKRAKQTNQGKYKDVKPIEKTMPKTTSRYVERGEMPYTNQTLKDIDKFTKRAKLMEEPFRYSKILEQNTGYDEVAQQGIYDLFQRANERVEELRELTQEKIGLPFKYGEYTQKAVLDRRIQAANEILSPTYLENLAATYKKDFIKNFEYHLEEDDFKRLKESVDQLTDFEMLELLKNTDRDYLAYALDSLIDSYGYERIMGDVDFLISRIKTGRGKLY